VAAPAVTSLDAALRLIITAVARPEEGVMVGHCWRQDRLVRAARQRRGVVSLSIAAAATVALSACAWVDPSQWPYLSTASYADESGPTPTMPPMAPFATTAAVAFRDGPSSGVRIRDVLPAGTLVQTDGRELNGWWGVRYGDVSGWIYAAYLRPQ
jgi:hypothetical protein